MGPSKGRNASRFDLICFTHVESRQEAFRLERKGFTDFSAPFGPQEYSEASLETTRFLLFDLHVSAVPHCSCIEFGKGDIEPIRFCFVHGFSHLRTFRSPRSRPLPLDRIGRRDERGNITERNGKRIRGLARRLSIPFRRYSDFASFANREGLDVRSAFDRREIERDRRAETSMEGMYDVRNVRFNDN